MTHELKNKAFTVEDDGIKAECTCGWLSRGHFTTVGANAAFQEHKDPHAKGDRNDTDATMKATLKEWWAEHLVGKVGKAAFCEGYRTGAGPRDLEIESLEERLNKAQLMIDSLRMKLGDGEKI